MNSNGAYDCLHNPEWFLEYADSAYVVIRRGNEAGQDVSNELFAARQALRACRLLIEAYRKADDGSGASIEWSDVDDAHQEALEAVTAASRARA